MKFIAGLIFCLCLSAAAFAQVPLNMQGSPTEAPLGNWIVGPIKALSSDGKTYCSMKNSFPGKHMLIFARNAEGGNSFAFDFGAQKLTAGGQYPVRLDIGALSRNMIGIAATNQILILQMGSDKPFYDMLRQKDVLHAVVNGQERRYGLQSAGDALDALEKCVAAQVEKKEFKTMEVVIKPFNESRAKSENSDDKSRNSVSQMSMDSSLLDEIEILRAQNRKLLLENQRISNTVHEDAMPRIETLPMMHEKNEGPVVKAVPVVSVLSKQQPSLPQPDPVPLAEKISVALKKHNIVARKSKDSWIVNGVSGNSVVYQAASVEKGKSILNLYLDAAEYECGGDFARKLSDASKVAGFNVVQGEAACIGDAQDKGRVFAMLQQGKNMTLIDFSASADTMTEALDMRDSFVSALSEAGQKQAATKSQR